MADREKVIAALHCRAYDDDFQCWQCAYYRQHEKPVVRCDYRGLMDDAIALLKEQEIGHWISLENCSNSGVYCSECHTKVFDNYPIKKKFSYFCPHCGTRMEGEIERR